jgi:hypothetical protein
MVGLMKGPSGCDYQFNRWHWIGYCQKICKLFGVWLVINEFAGKPEIDKISAELVVLLGTSLCD